MVFLCSSPGKTVTGVQRGEHTVARSSRLVLFSHGALLSKLQDTDKIFRNNKRNIRADEAIRFAFHQLKNSGRIAVLDADWKFNETFSYCLIAAPFIPLCINHHRRKRNHLAGTLCNQYLDLQAMSNTSEEESLNNFQQQAKLEACAAGSSKGDTVMPVVKKRRGHPGNLGMVLQFSTSTLGF